MESSIFDGVTFDYIRNVDRVSESKSKGKGKSQVINKGKYHRISKNNQPMSQITEKIINRFKEVANSKIGCISLGVPQCGSIRPISHDYGYYSSDMFYVTALSHDRTLSEWMEFIDRSIKHEYIYSFVKGFGKRISEFFYMNQRIRFICRKWILKMKLKIIKKRIIGCPDLFTTLPIPIESTVRIVDYKSKSIYVFHTNTAVRLILSGLMYNSYGITNPYIPKNPYTNMEWNVGQLTSIVGQIGCNLSPLQRFLPAWLRRFRQSSYTIRLFKINNDHKLNIAAANSFFKNIHEPDVVIIYGESVDDIFKYIVDELPEGYAIVKKLVMRRATPPALLVKWDSLVIAWFLYNNCDILQHPYNTLDALYAAVRSTTVHTLKWWRHHRRKIIPFPPGIVRTNVLPSTTAVATTFINVPYNELVPDE